MREDYEGFPVVLAQSRTDAEPGTERKIEVMIERFQRRESLFHPDDPAMLQVGPVLMTIKQFHHDASCDYRAVEGAGCVDLPLPPERTPHHHNGVRRRMSRAILGKCLQCHRADEIASRGLCRPCYQNSLRNVTMGNTTWRKLEKNGEAARAVRRKGKRRRRGAA